MNEALLVAKKKRSPIEGDTRILMHFDNNWTDACGGTILAATGSFNVSNKKFGGASASLPSNRAMTIQANAELYETGISEATVEAWFYKTSNPSWSGILVQGTSSSNVGGFCISPADGGDLVVVYPDANGVNKVGVLANNGAIPMNTWSHLAMTWKDKIATGYIGGKKQRTSPMDNWILRFNRPIEIGYLPYARTYTLPGLLDEFRFSSTCIYDGDFDVPTSPFEI